MQKKLELIWAQHQNSDHSGKRYLEYIISGQPLRVYLGIEPNSYVTPFGFFPVREEEKRALQEFRLQTHTKLPEDRIELYICDSCGDISCGAITAKIIDNGQTIRWTQFAYQNSPDSIGKPIAVEPLDFDRQTYLRVFATIRF